jgi:hypothetical protein
MKTLNLHTNNQQPTQKCAWIGLGMFSVNVIPAIESDYIRTKLGDVILE